MKYVRLQSQYAESVQVPEIEEPEFVICEREIGFGRDFGRDFGCGFGRWFGREFCCDFEMEFWRDFRIDFGREFGRDDSVSWPYGFLGSQVS